MKVAVVYFSLEGNTKYVAEKIAKVLDADMIQLIPVKEYPTGNAFLMKSFKYAVEHYYA